jgi:hypothetical protein
MNRWNIPSWLEKEVIERDKRCVYCGIKLIRNSRRKSSRKGVASWEHIINDAKITTRENIALCCVPCNSSKGTKALSDWINSAYCKSSGINIKTVSLIVRRALKNAPIKHVDLIKLSGLPTQ